MSAVVIGKFQTCEEVPQQPSAPNGDGLSCGQRYDQTIAFIHKKEIQYHDEVPNSSHEGTNLGIKEHSAPVLANESVHFNAEMLNFSLT